MIFNIFPQSLFLVGSDGTVATPDEDGDFDSFDMSHVEWMVCGDSPKAVGNYSLDMPAVSTTSPYAYQSHHSSEPCTSKIVESGKWKPSLSLSLMRNKPPGVMKQGQCRKSGKGHGEAWTKTTEICKYDQEENAIKKTLNLPITLNEMTVSVSGVGEIVSTESFEGEEVILDSDNLKIPDSAGTRGKLYLDYVSDVLYSRMQGWVVK